MTIREVLKHGPLAGLLWVLASPGLASADEVMDLARKRYESGERDYVNGRFWQAAKAFEEAFDLSKRPDLLFNAARAYDRGEYAVRAIETYEAYLKSTAASDQAQIELRLGELRKSLATLKINTKDKAFVSVDGHEYGQTPMSQPIPMDSGYHRIEVRDGLQKNALDFTTAEDDEPLGYMLENRTLRQTLREAALGARGVTLHMPDRAARVERNEAGIRAVRNQLTGANAQ